MGMLKIINLALIFSFLAKECHSQPDVCGVAPLNTEIMEGLVTVPGSWPWQASLRDKNGHICSGSLINSDWVLTTAFCIYGYSPQQLTVHLGVQSLTSSDANSVVRDVTKIILHPGYNFYYYSIDNDIALVQLNSSVNFTEYVKPVCLAAAGSTFFSGTQMWLTDWGLKINGTTGLNNLGEVKISVIGKRQCSCIIDVLTNIRVTDNIMCSEQLDTNSEQFKFGSPLVIKQGGRWIQAGIYLGFFKKYLNTRVSQYQNWINEEITSNQPGFVTFTSDGTDEDLSVSCSVVPPITTPTPVNFTTAALFGSSITDNGLTAVSTGTPTISTSTAVSSTTTVPKSVPATLRVLITTSGSTATSIASTGTVSTATTITETATVPITTAAVATSATVPQTTTAATVTVPEVTTITTATVPTTTTTATAAPVATTAIVPKTTTATTATVPKTTTATTATVPEITTITTTTTVPEITTITTTTTVPEITTITTSATVSTTTTVATTTASAVVCGSARLNTITGGGNSLASAGVWPWMASLQQNGTHVCGGTLVAEQFVLSAVDCLASSTSASEWTVILGRLKQSGSNPNEVSVSVTKISLSNSTVNNVAVLQLSHKPKLSDYIQPICVDLGEDNFTSNSQCWASGWGSGGGAEQTLQQFNTTILDCGSASSSSNSICTGVMPLEQTVTGGPLMCKIGQSWVQAAVLTLLTNTPRAANVQVFTKIKSFTSFLKAVVGTFPPKGNATSVNTTESPVSSRAPESSSLLSVTTFLLLSLTALIQMFS